MRRRLRPVALVVMRIRGAGGRQLSAFGDVKRHEHLRTLGSVSVSCFGIPPSSSSLPCAQKLVSPNSDSMAVSYRRQLSAFREPAGVSHAHSGSRWTSAMRIREAGGRQLCAFREPVGVSHPHSGGRRASAIRIRGAGERQLCAFGEPAGVSYPHSEGRWAPAIRIRGAGGRQLSAFGGPVNVSYAHSGSR